MSMFTRETITVNGQVFTNFGKNNYSCGMQLITCYPMPDNMVKDVLAGKYPKVYLNPSAPCSNQFYGVYGDKSQYEEFYKRQKNACIAGKMFSDYSYEELSELSSEDYRAIKSKYVEEYKDWWI